LLLITQDQSSNSHRQHHLDHHEPDEVADSAPNAIVAGDVNARGVVDNVFDISHGYGVGHGYP
jgi:hypothetical protein